MDNREKKDNRDNRVSHGLRLQVRNVVHQVDTRDKRDNSGNRDNRENRDDRDNRLSPGLNLQVRNSVGQGRYIPESVLSFV